ncbi:BTAD domain-containing putative transcriptional regulator [Actinokineospora guangxiensis]|uniref:BTAD domain-containing putative transcriptional regulator n=1 Tax=Actinokineospora guangxiensis TaxID=1490288 RepID=A0ABW0EIS0_9PSEU
MRFGVLGPLAVWTSSGEPVVIPGLKVRAVLADLLVHGGRPVSTDRLVEDLWGDDQPANPAGALQVRVSQLRKALGEDRDLVESRPPGYLLRTDAVDAIEFAALAARAGQQDDPAVRARLLADALALWRGPAYADFADDEFARSAAVRLEEQRLAVIELHAEARLELGEHSMLAGELGDLVAAHPLRERLRAVHMRALYRAGRQSEALDTYADLRKRLDDELGLEPGPELVALHQAVLEQDPALGGPSSAPAPRKRTNLPAALTELIGRDEAVAELRELLGTARLVTLTGPGGVGKTRLALETASGMSDADGVWLVELAALDRADSVADHLKAVLDIHDSGGPTDLAAAVAERRALLVLDNCEHLIGPVADLAADLLRAAPGLRVLATSREPLGVAGEVLWEVPPLEVPAEGADIERCSAVRLFAARAAAAARGFTVDAGNRDAVARLCARLDGIPLAIELAATRVRTLGVHGLVERLDDRFTLLTGPRGAPERQRTLTAVIDWSWGLLTDPERIVLRRLAVHAGGCTAEAAEVVCAGGDIAEEDVLDLLVRLVDRSLVVLADDPDGPRYRLLESVAAYGLDRLGEAGETERVRARHAAYYTSLAERGDVELRGSGQARWLRRLDAESPNLHSALSGRDASRLAVSMTWYRQLRGRLGDARRALAAVPADPQVRLARAWVSLRLGESAGWLDERAEVIACLDRVDPATRGRARWQLASAESALGDVARVGEQIEIALAECDRADDRWGTAAALCTRAMLAHARGDLEALRRDATRSADLFRDLGDRWGVLQATEWLAALAELTDDFATATRQHREGLRMAEDLGLWPDVAGRLAWLGWTATRLGEHGEALDLGREALRLAAEQDARSLTVFAEIVVAFAARRAGHPDLAETHLTHLLATAPDTDPPPLHLPMVHSELGHLAESRGDFDTAFTHHATAFDIAVAHGSGRDIASAAEGLAATAVPAGRPEEAARLLGAAAAHRAAHSLPVGQEELDEAERVGGLARAALGDAGFAAEYGRGGEIGLAGVRAALA